MAEGVEVEVAACTFISGWGGGTIEMGETGGVRQLTRCLESWKGAHHAKMMVEQSHKFYPHVHKTVDGEAKRSTSTE